MHRDAWYAAVHGGSKKLDTTESLICRKKMNCVSSGFSNPVSFNLATTSERYVSFPAISL